MSRRLLWLAEIAVLAGCGATSTSTMTPARTVTTTSTTTLRSTSVTSTRSTGPQARGAGAGAGCGSHQIAVLLGPRGVGLSHIGIVLRFRNTSSAGCILTGYPGATLTTASGREVQARRTPSGYLGGLSGSRRAPPVVHVGPGATVSALLEGSDADVAHGGRPCPRYAHLLVTPPNQRVTIRMATPLARVCAPEIHPVVPGAGGR